MSFTLKANISARIAGHHSGNARLASARLYTDRKLESPGDDAGGLFQSSKLQSRAQRTSAVSQNAQNGIACLQVQGAAGGQAMDFARYSRSLSLHPSGAPNRESISISMVNLDFTQAINSGDINPNYLTLEANGDEYLNNVFSISIAQISNAIAKVASTRTQNGSKQNAGRKYSQVLNSNPINLKVATGRILDTDIARESTQLAKHKILSEISASMNAQANRLNYSALTLISSN